MATIVNNPGPERVVERTDSSGWVVAIIILLVLIAGLFWWFRYYRAPAPAANESANINVTIPTPNIQGSSPTGSAEAN